MKSKKLISLSWNRGKYFDLWSLVHISSGLIMGIFFSLLNLSFLISLAIVSLLVILWELLEVYFKIIENLENVFSDLAFGILGFLLAFKYSPEEWKAKLIVLVIFILIGIILEFLGWKSFIKRGR